MPRKPPSPSEPADYRRWKFRAAALLERQGLCLERDWRHLYIRGVTPEEAAEQVQVIYWNTRPAVERMQRR
jgi:hypothetical protein